MNRRTKISSGILIAALILLASCGGVINLPVPSVSSLSPATVAENSVTFTLTVNGSGFAPSSTITFNSAPRQTIFLSPSQLTTQVNPGDIAVPGTIGVQVVTPAPGGGTSTTIDLTVTASPAPVPSISSITPTSVPAGQSTTITINGSGFVPTSLVTADGANRQANFTNASLLTVTLQPSDTATAGSVRIAVLNPPASGVNPPGGGLSNVISLNVVNPNPVASAVSPSVLVGGSTTTASLLISGSGFDSASQVLVNGSGRPTTFGNSSAIAAQLASGDLAAAGTYPVQVVNPSPGGGTSAVLFFSIVPSATGAGLPELVDVAADGAQANDGAGDPSVSGPAMDTTGRFVAFTSPSTNLLETTTTNPPPNPITNGAPNVFLRDTCLGMTSGCTPNEILVDLDPSGIVSNGASSQPAVDSNASIVTFTSVATDLVSGFSFDGTTPQVFAANPCAGATVGCTRSVSLVSVGADGVTPALGAASQSSVSGDGRFVAFTSIATNLVAGATTGASEVYLRDTCLAAGPACKPVTILVSVAADGVTPADGSNSQPVVVSGKTGQFVAFTSTATNLVTGSGGAAEIYRAGFCIGISKGCTAASAILISTPDGTTFADGSSMEPTMTPDGRFIAFASTASDLGAASGGVQEIYLRDTCQGVPTGCTAKTSTVSLASDGVTLANALSEHPSLGTAGRFVAFASLASNLSTANLNGLENIYAHDTCLSAPNGCLPSTALVSVSATKTPGNGASLNPVISGTGHVISFFSAASNLVNNDLNGFPDIFLVGSTF
ncbi:MAG: IPT/TIG domain-containing protein [Candidatus Acidiferrales bacterium]